MEDRSALVSPSQGQGLPHAQPPLSSCCFPLVDVRDNPLGLGNIGKPVNGVDLNGLVQSPWPASIFLGNIANNRVLNTRPGNDVWEETVSCRMETINPSQVTETPVQHLMALGAANMFDDFQARGGVVNSVCVQEDQICPQPGVPLMSMVSEQHRDWVQLSSGFDFSRTGVPLVPGFRNVSPDSMLIAGGIEKKKGLPEEIKDKTLERRQRRMIKNRESAARSRAKKQVKNETQSYGDFYLPLNNSIKKQAYTHDLEKRVRYLQKMNKWLKKVMELRLSMNSTSKPKHQLRRSSSAKF